MSQQEKETDQKNHCPDPAGTDESANQADNTDMTDWDREEFFRLMPCGD